MSTTLRRAQHVPHPATLDLTPACQDRPLNDFFGHSSGTNTIKAICADCPVREACDAYAMAYDVRGVWAGTTYPERNRRRAELGILPLSVFSHTPRDNDILRERWPNGGRRRRAAVLAGQVASR